jgi:hypothetical protein
MFFAPESLSTCNYCDETGRGLASEVPFATAARNESLGSGSRHGTAAMYFTPSATIFGSAGAVTTATTIVVGHGVVEFEAAVDVWSEDAEYGWAIYMVHDGATSFVGTANQNGVPRGVRGYALEWHWLGTSADDNRLRSLQGSTASLIEIDTIGIAPALGPTAAGESVRQRLRIDLTPDDPTTPANETTIRAGVGGAGFAGRLQCGTPGRPTCPVRVAVGDRLWFGVSSGSTMRGTVTRTGCWASHSAVEIRRRGLCP